MNEQPEKDLDYIRSSSHSSQSSLIKTDNHHQTKLVNGYHEEKNLKGDQLYRPSHGYARFQQNQDLREARSTPNDRPHLYKQHTLGVKRLNPELYFTERTLLPYFTLISNKRTRTLKFEKSF